MEINGHRFIRNKHETWDLHPKSRTPPPSSPRFAVTFVLSLSQSILAYCLVTGDFLSPSVNSPGELNVLPLVIWQKKIAIHAIKQHLYSMYVDIRLYLGCVPIHDTAWNFVFYTALSIWPVRPSITLDSIHVVCERPQTAKTKISQIYFYAFLLPGSPRNFSDEKVTPKIRNLLFFWGLFFSFTDAITCIPSS